MIRKARISDVVEMKQIINTYSKDELMLARSLSEMYENIRDYYVCEIEGEVIGCCASMLSGKTLLKSCSRS